MRRAWVRNPWDKKRSKLACSYVDPSHSGKSSTIVGVCNQVYNWHYTA